MFVTSARVVRPLEAEEETRGVGVKGGWGAGLQAMLNVSIRDSVEHGGS